MADDVSEDAVKLVEEMGPESISEDDVSATPVVKLTNLIIRDAINQGASDIHIEPGRKLGAVRYRVDGVLRKHMDLPMAALNRIVSRIKVLSQLDIADRLRPQDGKARVQVKGRAFDLRVSTIPAGGAEKCVMRVLDSSSALSLDELEIPKKELERLRGLLTHRSGIVVVTGPDRVRQDHDALRGAAGARRRQGQHHDRRGPDRVRARRGSRRRRCTRSRG